MVSSKFKYSIDTLRALIMCLLLIVSSIQAQSQCLENLLLNGDFETGNTSNWTSTGLPLAQSGCYNQDGNYYLWYNGSGSLLWQEVNAESGRLYTLEFYDGAHDIDGQKISMIFMDQSGVDLLRVDHFTGFDVDNENCMLQANTLSAHSPEETTTVRIEISLNNAGLKADGFCLTAADPVIDDECADWIQGPPNSALIAGVITNPGLISSLDDLVNITFVVVNSSDHPIENIQLTPAVKLLNGAETGIILNPVFAQDPNGNGLLDPQEIWFFSAVESFEFNEGDSFIISCGVSGNCPCGQEIGGGADLLFTTGANMDVKLKGRL